MAQQLSWDENSGELFDDYKGKIDKEIKLLETMGYAFFVDCHGDVYVPDRVKIPDGRIFDGSELERELKSDPTTELVRAMRLFYLYFAEGWEDERHASVSFLGNDDIKITLKKYGASKEDISTFLKRESF